MTESPRRDSGEPFWQRRPWLFALLGGLTVGAIVGVLAAEGTSLAVRLVSGSIFAVGLFLILGVLGWTEAWARRNHPVAMRRWRGWQLAHQLLSAVLAAIFAFSFALAIQTLSGKSTAFSLKFAGTVAVLILAFLAAYEWLRRRKDSSIP